MNVNFLLDHYRVYPKHNKITNENKVTILEPKIIQVLCFMVHHQGEVLSREYIADNLWPDTIVGLEVITRAIFELRKVLNDDAKNPKYIETIARKGYCFIGKAEPINKAKSQAYLPSLLLVKLGHKSAILTALLLTIITFFLLISPIALFKNFQISNTKPENYQATILSDGIENIQSAALSADGSKVLYIQTDAKSNESVLILKDVKSHKYSILQRGTEMYRSVIWTEKNNIGYFIQCNTSECKINKLFVDTGKLQVVYKTNKRLKTIKLSAKGKTLALTAINKHRLSISLLSLDSQREVPIKLDNKASNYAATFNNIEPAIFYVQQKNSHSTINSYNLVSQHSRIISTKFSKVTSLHSEDDANLLIAGQIDSLYSVWRFNLNTNEISQALSIPTNTHAYELVSSQSSQLLFYLKKSSNINIGAQGLANHIDLKQVNSYANDLNAIWSRPTNTLYFVSQRTGSYELWSHNRHKNTKLTGIQADSIRRPILNEKKNQLAFVAAKNNQLKLMIYDIATGQLTVNQNIDKEVHLLSWSTKGNSIYMSMASENIYDIWQFDIVSLKSKKILLAAGLLAKEQEDKSFIFGDIKSQKLMVKKANGTMSIIKDFKGVSLQFRPHSIKINNNSDHLYYVEQKPTSIQVMSTPLGVMVQETPKELFTLTTNDFITDIGRHGKDYVIYDHFVSKTSQLLLLQAVD